MHRGAPAKGGLWAGGPPEKREDGEPAFLYLNK